MAVSPDLMFLSDHVGGPKPGTVLALIDDLPDHGGKSLDFRVEEGHLVSIFIQKKGDCVQVYHNRCPHAGTPLNLFNDRFMDIENESLLCRTHGAKFDFETGQCLSGPCRQEFLRKVAFEVDASGRILSK